MWTYEHTIHTQAKADALWALYSDVSTWSSWDGDNEGTTLDGEFVAGSRGRMTFKGQDPIDYTLVEVEPERFFVDESDFGAFAVRFEHQLIPTEQGTQITHRILISGQAAAQVGPDLGPKITADVPVAMANIAKMALRQQ